MDIQHIVMAVGQRLGEWWTGRSWPCRIEDKGFQIGFRSDRQFWRIVLVRSV